MLFVDQINQDFCVKCRKGTENIDPNMVRTKNNRLIMQEECPACRIKSQDL